MGQLAKASIVLILLFVLAVPQPAVAADEYLTEDELDLIRDAQELSQRVPVYLKLAQKRLAFLGLIEKSKEEIEREQKERAKREKDAKKPANPAETKANAKKVTLEDMTYLADFTRSELLRGYVQALDEVMSNIDDAFNRRLEVRDSLEDLEKFTRETMPVLQKFQPKHDGEKFALEEASDKAKEANTGAKEAMNIVPKTEKKRQP
jgi:hypothetical protein